jgi:SAM-dependent methyltransferase
MNYHNAKLNAFAVYQLQVTPSDRILEIGFGGGVNLPALLARAAFVAGVDRSEDMVTRAAAMYSGPMKAGRAAFRVGSVEALPFESGIFKKVCTVNTVYFWSSLARAFAEIHRVLAPGGRAVVGFLPKQWMDRLRMPEDIFTARTSEEVIAATSAAGFEGVSVERPGAETAWNVIVGTRRISS